MKCKINYLIYVSEENIPDKNISNPEVYLSARKLYLNLVDILSKDNEVRNCLNNLEDNIKEGRDFLGRDFKYKIDESELPKYLIDNKEKYQHLML
jgi:hypothetical protein